MHIVNNKNHYCVFNIIYLHKCTRGFFYSILPTMERPSLVEFGFIVQDQKYVEILWDLISLIYGMHYYSELSIITAAISPSCDIVCRNKGMWKTCILVVKKSLFKRRQKIHILLQLIQYFFRGPFRLRRQ